MGEGLVEANLVMRERMIPEIRIGENIYCKRVSLWRRTLFSGVTRNAACTLHEFSCKLDAKRTFSLSSVGAQGEIKIHMEPLSLHGRLIQSTNYEGHIYLNNAEVGVVKLVNNLTAPLLELRCQNGDFINVSRQELRNPYAKLVLSSKLIGEVANLCGDNPRISVRELLKSRFGFGKVHTGVWQADGFSLSQYGVETYISAIALVELMETLVPLSFGQCTSIGS